MGNLTNSAKLIEKIWGLNVTKIGASAPSNPVEWNLWYDTTNDVLKSYDWTNWNIIWDEAAWWNISWTLSDQTDLQAALDAKVWSSNNTINNVVHLSQADYDALQNPDSNTWYSTPDSWSGWFDPENAGSVWQVVTKTATWYAYADAPVKSVNGQTWDVTWLLTAETVLSWDSWTTYTIKTSSTAPAAWTANNIITFVTQ